MTFLLDYEPPWIGVPEYWPFPRPDGDPLPSIPVWANELVEEIRSSSPLTDDQAEHVRSVAVMVAERAQASRCRHYLAFDEPGGAAFIVSSELRAEEDLGIQSLREYVGEGDPAHIGVPFAEDFTSNSGVRGARCYRYLSYDEELGSIYGRADYAFVAGGELLTLTAMELDLVWFDRTLPLVEELARSVRWAE